MVRKSNEIIRRIFDMFIARKINNNVEYTRYFAYIIAVFVVVACSCTFSMSPAIVDVGKQYVQQDENASVAAAQKSPNAQPQPQELLIDKPNGGVGFDFFSLGIVSRDECKDNVVIVLFYTTWCGCCPAVLRQLDELCGRKLNNVKIIAVNIEADAIVDIKKDRSNIDGHFKLYNITNLPIYKSVDNGKTRIDSIPLVFVYDKSGNFVKKYLGAEIDYNSDAFVKFIKSLF